MVCDTWIFGERGLVDMLVLTYFFSHFYFLTFTSLLLYLRYFFIFPKRRKNVSLYFDIVFSKGCHEGGVRNGGEG